MVVTKTDFMRGMQCPRMLWLDKHPLVKIAKVTDGVRKEKIVMPSKRESLL